MQNNYVWQATQFNGLVVTRGESIESAVKVELVPQAKCVSNIGGQSDTHILPRHTFVCQKFVRRFGRGFLNGLGGGMREYLHCIVCKTFRIYVFSSTGAVLITPPDFELYL